MQLSAGRIEQVALARQRRGERGERREGRQGRVVQQARIDDIAVLGRARLDPAEQRTVVLAVRLEAGAAGVGDLAAGAAAGADRRLRHRPGALAGDRLEPAAADEDAKERLDPKDRDFHTGLVGDHGRALP